MLTGDLVLVKIEKKQVRPRLIDPASKRYLTFADSIVNTVRKAFEKKSPRLDIEAEFSELCSAITDHKVINGLAKIMMDRCEFDYSALQEQFSITPYELRMEAFDLGQLKGPLAYSSHPEWPSSKIILELLASKYDCDVQLVRRFIYADRKDMQAISKIRSFSHHHLLLHRYNIGLCQAILLRATRLEVQLESPGPKMLRQFLQSIKFHRLMFTVQSVGKNITIILDGPQSLLTMSSRYGMQLANCFPVIPLFECEWKVHADLLWGKKRKFKKFFEVSSNSGLLSHYQRKGTWRSNAELWFEERFLALESDWTLEPGGPIPSIDQNILVPDFCFRRGNVIVYMEIIGFWRKDYLQHRVRQCPKNMLMAVSRKLVSDKKKIPKKISEQIIEFAEIIPAKTVLKKLDDFI